MHATTGSRPMSPTRHHAFESVWPSDNAATIPVPVSRASFTSAGLPLSPPPSPDKPLRKSQVDSPSATPVSPRNSPHQPPSPPKRGVLRGLTHYKSSAQHLGFVREKLPTLVHALSLQDSVPGEHGHGSEGADTRRVSDDSAASDRMPSPGLFVSAYVSRGTVDALGLILGGGDEAKKVSASLRTREEVTCVPACDL